MPTAYFYLTDGFADDHVIVSVDGRNVLDEQGVTTAKLYGLAKEIDPVSVTGNSVRVEVEIPQKGMRSAMSVDLSKGTHVPIAVEAGQLKHSVVKKIGFA